MYQWKPALLKALRVFHLRLPTLLPTPCRIFAGETLSPLSHGACTRNSKPRAFATVSLTEPRHHAVKLRHGFVAPATVVPSKPPRFATAQASDNPRSPACGLQAATVSLTEPRHHAVKLRHGFIAPATAAPSNPPRFATALASIKPLASLRLAGATVEGA